MGFTLFILLNATLLTRPTELVPELHSVQLYLILILSCLVVSFPKVLHTLLGNHRDPRPITICVLGIWAAVILSHLSHGDLDKTAKYAEFFFRVTLYYVLLVSVVDSPLRVRQFTFWLIMCLVGMAIISLLQYYDVVELSDLSALKEKVKRGGEVEIVKRLHGPGRLFGDPNDVCSVFVVGILLSLSRAGDLRSRLLRYLWLGPIGLFLYCMYLSQSRGGFLGLLIGLSVLCHAHWGLKRTLWIGVPLLLGMLFMLGGRQTDLSTSQGTSQQRIQIWAEGIRFFRSAPLFGIGMNEFATALGEEGLVAHNSYVHAFAELGFLGGALFCGAFYLAITMLIQAGPPLEEQSDDDLRRFRPYLLATVVGYAVCIFSLSLCYLETTYTVLGLAAAYLSVASQDVSLPPFSTSLVRRLAIVGVVSLVVLFVFIKVFVRF